VSEGKYSLKVVVIIEDDVCDVIAVQFGRALLAVVDFAQILIIFGKEFFLTNARLEWRRGKRRN
jgi:hypothetical protein